MSLLIHTTLTKHPDPVWSPHGSRPPDMAAVCPPDCSDHPCVDVDKENDGD